MQCKYLAIPCTQGVYRIVDIQTNDTRDLPIAEGRWTTDMTLGQFWECLSPVRIVEESTSLCLPNPAIQTKTLSEFLSYHFRAKWEWSPDQFSPSGTGHRSTGRIFRREGREMENKCQEHDEYWVYCGVVWMYSGMSSINPWTRLLNKMSVLIKLK